MAPQYHWLAATERCGFQYFPLLYASWADIRSSSSSSSITYVRDLIFAPLSTSSYTIDPWQVEAACKALPYFPPDVLTTAPLSTSSRITDFVYESKLPTLRCHIPTKICFSVSQDEDDGLCLVTYLAEQGLGVEL